MLATAIFRKGFGVHYQAMCRFVIFAATALSAATTLSAGASQAVTPPRWADLATGDLNALHDIIRDDHPGPVNVSDPGFRRWLEEGRRLALAKARVVRTESDYWRALRFYINGFRDGHLAVWRAAKSDVKTMWPGFLTLSDRLGRTRVTVSQRPDIPVGASVIACDGMSTQRLLAERVYPYRVNADIPHEKITASPFLFVSSTSDLGNQFRRCRIKTGALVRSIDLKWMTLEPAAFTQNLSDAQRLVTPKMGVRKVDGVWFVSLPSFNQWGDDAKTMQALVGEVKALAPSLHAAPYVVIDVRGNTGGNSAWGRQIAAALWGEAPVDDLAHSFDWTVDWRPSARNVALTRQAAARSKEAGLADDAAVRTAVADGMQAALARRDTFYRQPERPTTKGLPNGYVSPFKGRVFFLTDTRCASACLDFADLVVRMPGVVHVGLPTSADTIYIDNVAVDVPSGRASLSYSLKVYRNRVRSNNQWYEPKVKWPDGDMNDPSVAAWIKRL